jgi:hypothetical protein
MLAIRLSCIVELVSMMERFHSCITMALGWGEGELKNFVMVGFGDFVVVGNGYNSCYKEWHFGGMDHLGGQIEKN